MTQRKCSRVYCPYPAGEIQPQGRCSPAYFCAPHWRMLSDAERDGYETVSHPGKFEGEQSYVPWAWSVVLDGFGGVEHRDGSQSVCVTAEDRKLFKTLKGRRSVRLYQRDDGFVVEV